VALSDGVHHFDGDIFLLAPHDASLDQIVALFPGEDIEQDLVNPHDGWTVISGGLPVFTERGPRRLAGAGSAWWLSGADQSLKPNRAASAGRPGIGLTKAPALDDQAAGFGDKLLPSLAATLE
jgi:hypothetical protein